jgi:hypothetical protein
MEVLEQPELGGRHRDDIAVDSDYTIAPIEFDRAVGEAAWSLDGSPPSAAREARRT